MGLEAGGYRIADHLPRTTPIDTPRHALRALKLLGVALLLVSCGETIPIDSSSQATEVQLSATFAATPPQFTEPEFSKPQPTGDIPTAAPPMRSSFDSDNDGFMTREELLQALIETEAQYPLPPGYQVAPEALWVLITASHPADAKYENGAEYSILGNPHRCAWIQTFLDANLRGDNLTKDIAMNQLTTVTLHNPMYHQDMKALLADMLQAAALGDVAPIKQFADVNCNWDVFEATPTIP